MTREEAITYLNVIWNRYKAEYEIERETLDAYHMAIEALSAEEAVWNEYEAEFTNLPDIPRYYYEKVVGKMAHEINMLREQLESAEAVQGEWILAEERPPEFPCLVCDANGNQPSVPMGIVTITDEEYGEWHIDGRLWDSPKVFVDGEWGNRIAYGNRIIAWQPLPKPYKGGDEE